jgi:predicted kinase
MVGLPCSGKTTRAKEIEKKANAVRFMPDEWHIRLFGQDASDAEHDARHAAIEAIMTELGYALLAKGLNVVLDYGCWARNRCLPAGCFAITESEFEGYLEHWQAPSAEELL